MRRNQEKNEREIIFEEKSNLIQLWGIINFISPFYYLSGAYYLLKLELIYDSFSRSSKISWSKE